MSLAPRPGAGWLTNLRAACASTSPVSASYWTLLRYQAACAAIEAHQEEEGCALAAAYARDALASWEAARAGLERLDLRDPTLGAVTLLVSQAPPESTLLVAHGVLLARDPALLASLGRWALAGAHLRDGNVAPFAPSMIEALLAVCHRSPDALLRVEAARKVSPANLDAARVFGGQLEQVARGEPVTPAYRALDPLWNDPESADYRAFWRLAELAVVALRGCSPAPDDDYPQRRAARDADPAEIAARLAPQAGFLWVADVSRALEAGCHELAARFERDAQARQAGLDALVAMLQASLSQLPASDRPGASDVVSRASEALKTALAPLERRRAWDESLARYERRAASGEADPSEGAPFAVALRSRARDALEWLASRHPGALHAPLVAALCAAAPAWSPDWISFVFDEAGEEAARGLMARGSCFAQSLADIAGDRVPLRWMALDRALSEDTDGRHGMTTGARTIAIAQGLLGEPDAARKLRERFASRPPPLGKALLRWLEEQSIPREPSSPVDVEAMLEQWLASQAQDAPPPSPSPSPTAVKRRRKR